MDPYHQRALQSNTPPKSKSDTQWLNDMGYEDDLIEFSIMYGFNMDQEHLARQHVSNLREEQQKEWEALRRDKASSSKSKKHKAKVAEAENAVTSSESNEMQGLVMEGIGGKKDDKASIKELQEIP